jgi:hypothetical protein
VIPGIGGARLPWERGGGGGGSVSPLTIFPSGNLLWIDGYGGRYLRDAGGNVPDNSEAVTTLINRGRGVGNATAASAGVVYASAAMGGLGGVSFNGTVGAVASTPAWVLAGRASGGAVWRFADTSPRALYQHGGVNGHTSVFRDSGSLRVRRLSAADATVASTSLVSRWTVFRADTTTSRIEDSEGTGSETSAVAVPSTSVATTIGGLSSSVYVMNGTIGEFVLWDGFASDAQLASLKAYFIARWGL